MSTIEMRDVYVRACNTLMGEPQEFFMPAEALLSVRFSGLTTLLAAKHLQPRMVIIDEGQHLIVESVSIEPKDDE